MTTFDNRSDWPAEQAMNPSLWRALQCVADAVFQKSITPMRNGLGQEEMFLRSSPAVDEFSNGFLPSDEAERLFAVAKSAS